MSTSSPTVMLPPGFCAAAAPTNMPMMPAISTTRVMPRRTVPIPMAGSSRSAAEFLPPSLAGILGRIALPALRRRTRPRPRRAALHQRPIGDRKHPLHPIEPQRIAADQDAFLPPFDALDDARGGLVRAVSGHAVEIPNSFGRLLLIHGRSDPRAPGDSRPDVTGMPPRSEPPRPPRARGPPPPSGAPRPRRRQARRRHDRRAPDDNPAQPGALPALRRYLWRRRSRRRHRLAAEMSSTIFL